MDHPRPNQTPSDGTTCVTDLGIQTESFTLPAATYSREQDKAEPVTGMQHYRPETWELNFDLHAFKRWRHVGSAQGLTNDTEIACFLLQQFEKTHKLTGSSSYVRCNKCHSVLTQFCAKCSANPDDTFLQHLTNKIENANGSAQAVFRSEDTRKRSQNDGGNNAMGHKAAKRKKVEQLSCAVCSVTFTQATSLRVHMRKHTGEKPYMCSVCGASFTHSSSLSVHKRSHTGVKPFVCEQCGAAFAVGSVLKQHMRKHSGEKPYKCGLCPSAFTQSTKLTIHMRKHTGARPYQCEQCGAGFTNSNRLKIHLRSHSGHRPYRCTECSKTFAQSAHLTIHARIHTGDKPFKCTECDAAFRDSSHLRRHERTHRSEKPHVCKECGMSYSTAFGLRRHEWSHTDSEKPYKCPSCSQTFSSNFCLKRHMSRGKCDCQEPRSQTMS